MTQADDRPLRIGILSYRSNPFCGGQGVYVTHLARALHRLGHQVEIISGPPDPIVPDGVTLTRLPGLDLYNPEDPFRMPSFSELSDPVNFLEWAGVSSMGFPEPFTFGIRAYQYLRGRIQSYDVLHDNQSLSYGIWRIGKLAPLVATIHHPITVDRDLDVRAARTFARKLQTFRWYSFIGMQKRVARSLPHIVTVSRFAMQDIMKEFRMDGSRFHVAPNGIDIRKFYPIPEIPREAGRVMVTNSADTPLKGLRYLLIGIRELSRVRDVHLVVIGSPRPNGGVEALVRDLDLGNRVTFTGRVDDGELVRQYARASVAVVPSLYEGFGLPAGEAMACAVPVISTTGGALPEVVGEAGILVPPGDSDALAKALCTLLDSPVKAAELGREGFRRVRDRFTWENAARKTVEVYRRAIDAHG